MSTVSAPADRRFRRAHVKPARRRRNWITRLVPVAMYGLLGLLVAYAMYRGSSVVAHAHVLQVNRIVVRGNERLAEGDVLAVLSGLQGESLLWTDLDRWRRRLLASPWVRDAALRRSLPSTVEVMVWERQPIGIGRINGEMYLVDEDGVIVDEYGPQYSDMDLPIIDGLTRSTDQEGPGTDEARAGLAARVIAALRVKPAVARMLSQVDVTDVRNAAVILNGDSAVIQLGDDQFLSRLQGYLELAPSLHARVPDIDSVDVRFDSRIYVRPTRTSQKPAEKSAKNDKATVDKGLAKDGPASREHRTTKR
jgi:cell division protein FtsQ